MVFPCALGRGGISAGKREGDGATPLGPMRILSAIFAATRSSPKYDPARHDADRSADLGWCEVPDDRNYNRPVTIPYAASHETHAAQGPISTIVCLVLDWNIAPAPPRARQRHLLPPCAAGLPADARAASR